MDFTKAWNDTAEVREKLPERSLHQLEVLADKGAKYLDAVEVDIEELEKFVQENDSFVELKQNQVEDELNEEDLYRLSNIAHMSNPSPQMKKRKSTSQKPGNLENLK